MRTIELEAKLNNEHQRILLLENELAALGDGKLHIHHKEGKPFFREYINGRQHGITGDKNRIYQLARKDVLNEEIRVARENVYALEKAYRTICKNDKSLGIDKLIERYNMLDKNRLLYSAQTLEWYNNRQSHNPFNKEWLIYKTQGEVVTRSKSERFIGSFLESKDLIYMYEAEIIIGGKNYYPDFMVLRPDGKPVMWEHCGLMDNAEYFDKMNTKIKEYQKIGFVRNVNLICTYEEDLKSTAILEEILKRYIYV